MQLESRTHELIRQWPMDMDMDMDTEECRVALSLFLCQTLVVWSTGLCGLFILGRGDKSGSCDRQASDDFIF